MNNTINTQLLNNVQTVMLAKRQQVITDFIGSSNIEEVGLNARLALTLQANLETYGYGFSVELLKALSNSSESQLVAFNAWLNPAIEEGIGAHRQFTPMYPNFPKQVFDASRAELIINAIMHYTGDMLGLRIMPQYIKEVRMPLDNAPKNVPEGFFNDLPNANSLKVLKAGSMQDVVALFVAIANSNTSLSSSDKESFAHLFNYFVATGEVPSLLQSSDVKIVQKETLAYVTKLVLDNKLPLDCVKAQFKTATDILRTGVALSEGDISLAAPTKFIKFGRPMRKVFLELLEYVVATGGKEAVIENMFQYRSAWLRLGEKIHPTEYKNQYPLAAEVFNTLRNEKKPLNFNGKLDITLEAKDFSAAIEHLKQRPGVFARSLNRILQRIEGNEAQPLAVDFKEQPQFNNMFSNTPAKPVAPMVKSKLAEQLEAFNIYADINKPEINLQNVKAKLGREEMAFEPVGKEIMDIVTLSKLSKEDREQLTGDTIRAFAEVAHEVSTPVLLQVYNHFKHQQEITDRVFLPKGNLAKTFIAPTNVVALAQPVTEDLAFICREALIARFKQLPALGTVYIDEQLKTQNVPFAMRSASKALKTVARGSQIDINEPGQPAADTTRFFVWWHDMEVSAKDKELHGSYYNPGRVDIDLSVVFLDTNYQYVDHCSFTNLKGKGFAHSGDITSAPDGACEFIDINKSQLDPRIQYVTMVINSYTNQPYYELPECFAGWMERDRPQTGEIYEPRTVKNKFDITSDTQTVLPMIVDVKNDKVIWADLSLTKCDFWNIVERQNPMIERAVKSMVNISKPTLYDLFEMHAVARGTIVDQLQDAQTVFAVHEGITPYDYEVIASQFMADKVETPKPKKKM